MSEMTEALQRIEAWLQYHMPNRAAELRPGLTRDEIEEQVKDLPFSLPEEVYELYQWHDGSKVLEGIDLILSAEEVFAWLKLHQNNKKIDL